MGNARTWKPELAPLHGYGDALATEFRPVVADQPEDHIEASTGH
jgi:hypothetical protein